MTTTNKPNLVLFFGMLLCICLVCFLVTFSPKFKINPDLFTNAILFDLLITAPLMYLFMIRKTAVPKSTVFRVFFAGVLVAGWLLNNHSNALLQFIKFWISPLIESVLLFYIGRKFNLAKKNVKKLGVTSLDFLTHCRMIMHELTGSEKAGNIISSEIAVLYYAFIGKKDKTADSKSTFSSYKESGILLVLGTLLSLFLIETIGFHFILTLWNKTIAWILTGLSLYTCIQLFAHIKAIRARPVKLTADTLDIRNGLAGDASISYDNIESIELSHKMPVDRKPVKLALLKGLENHNCIVYLKQPVEVTIIFGIKKRADSILFFVDRSKEFMAALNIRLKAGIIETDPS